MFKILLTIVLVMGITISINAEDPPDCTDPCNPTCTNYDPQAECNLIPVNENAHFLILSGILLGFVFYKIKLKSGDVK